MIVPQETTRVAQVPKIEMHTPIIQRVLANERRDWNFDMNAYMARMQESHKDAVEGNQDTENKGGEGENRMECFPTMREDGMTIGRLFSKKKHPKGLKDMNVETMRIKSKLGWRVISMSFTLRPPQLKKQV